VRSYGGSVHDGDRDLLAELFRATERELPEPKPKRTKRKPGSPKKKKK